jgi:Family of unknown function (DUF6288)
MKRILRIIIPTFTAIASAAMAQQAYYKNPDALFSRRPDAAAPISHVQRFGPVGLSIDLIQPAFTMQIKGVEPGSPAMQAGLKQGMIIHSINGEKLADIDPRIQLGNMLTKAEATDGKIRMMVSNKPDSETRELLMQIPVLGQFSDTWPLNCPKSDKIVRNFAEYLKAGGNQGFASFGPLFLLSTGDESDLEHVRKWARSRPSKINGFHTWHSGLGNWALCEYICARATRMCCPRFRPWPTSSSNPRTTAAGATRHRSETSTTVAVAVTSTQAACMRRRC